MGLNLGTKQRVSFQVPPHNDIVDEAGTSLLLNLGKANSNKLLYKNFYLSDLHAYKYGIIFSLYNNAQNLRILFFYRENTGEHSQKRHKSKHKKHSKDKDEYKGVSRDDYESMDTINDEPCWMAPLIRVRIISKSFKNGKYYHKKVGIVIYHISCLYKTCGGSSALIGGGMHIHIQSTLFQNRLVGQNLNI